jgi:hypothetical protein
VLQVAFPRPKTSPLIFFQKDHKNFSHHTLGNFHYHHSQQQQIQQQQQQQQQQQLQQQQQQIQQQQQQIQQQQQQIQQQQQPLATGNRHSTQAGQSVEAKDKYNNQKAYPVTEQKAPVQQARINVLYSNESSIEGLKNNNNTIGANQNNTKEGKNGSILNNISNNKGENVNPLGNCVNQLPANKNSNIFPSNAKREVLMPKQYGSEIATYKPSDDGKVSPLNQVNANIPLNRPSLKSEPQKVYLYLLNLLL